MIDQELQDENVRHAYFEKYVKQNIIAVTIHLGYDHQFFTLLRLRNINVEDENGIYEYLKDHY